mmetsp:Transcript_2323/g.7127  ORF Transcript_2323/g.7127 Transcript_2323/m.7127 type:complete len:399 (+) Transcript_2323:686-1882(+)
MNVRNPIARRHRGDDWRDFRVERVMDARKEVMLNLIIDSTKEEAERAATPVGRGGNLLGSPRRAERALGGIRVGRQVLQGCQVDVRSVSVMVGQDVGSIRDVASKEVGSSGDKRQAGTSCAAKDRHPDREPDVQGCFPGRDSAMLVGHQGCHLPQVFLDAKAYERVLQGLAEVHAGEDEHGSKLQERREANVAISRRLGGLAHEGSPVAKVRVALVVAGAGVVQLDVVLVPEPWRPIGDGGPERHEAAVHRSSSGEGEVRRVVKLNEPPSNERESRTEGGERGNGPARGGRGRDGACREQQEQPRAESARTLDERVRAPLSARIFGMLLREVLIDREAHSVAKLVLPHHSRLFASGRLRAAPRRVGQHVCVQPSEIPLRVAVRALEQALSCRLVQSRC